MKSIFHWNYKPKHITLILFFPIFPSDTPKNIRKPEVFLCFLGDQKGTMGRKGLIKRKLSKVFACDFEKYFRTGF